MLRVLCAMLRDEGAATMTEYAIIASLLSAGTLAMLVVIAQSANNSLSTVTSATQAYQVAPPP